MNNGEQLHIGGKKVLAIRRRCRRRRRHRPCSLSPNDHSERGSLPRRVWVVYTQLSGKKTSGYGEKIVSDLHIGMVIKICYNARGRWDTGRRKKYA